MTEEQSIIIDILKLVPDNSICYINAPSINEDSAILKILSSAEQYNWNLMLTLENKRILTAIISSESIQDYFHRLYIKFDNSTLCESYDGMCTVILSDTLKIPEWFSDKYVRDGLCWNMK